MAPSRTAALTTERLELVRRIYHARFAARVAKSGLDVEDVLQEVFLGLCTRAHGTSGWDESRGSWSTYAYTVTSSVVLNALQRTRSKKARLWLTGVPGPDGERDAAQSSRLIEPAPQLAREAMEAAVERWMADRPAPPRLVLGGRRRRRDVPSANQLPPVSDAGQLLLFPPHLEVVVGGEGDR